MALNRWTGIGRLTRDADVRYAQKQDGTQMCIARFTLAVDRKFKQEGQQSADFISCVAFGKQGEFVEKYLKQGIKVVVSGRIQTGSYTNKDGQKVYTTDIVTDEIEFAESKSESKSNSAEEPPASDGFIDIPDGIENDLPFR